MKLREIYKSNTPAISFEVFPPKAKNTDEKEGKIQVLIDELKLLSKYNPAFVSVTYGAGGTTRETTFDLVLRIQQELGIQPMPHFTCVGSTKDEILQYIKEFETRGISNILALRGDPPRGEENFIKPKDGFGYANELVDFIKAQTTLGIAVAGYPECHQDCSSLSLDIENLKRKIDCGGETVITQVFYDNQCYFDFLEKTTKQGINTPIIPGILPITAYAQLERIVGLSGCSFPETVRSKLDANKDNPKAVKEIGIEFAIKQCQELLAYGVPGIHFYTLNKAFATQSVLEELKINNKNEFTNV